MKIRVFVNAQGAHALPEDLSDLPSVELECSPETTLYELGETAAERLGVSLSSPSLLFVSGADPQATRRPSAHPRAFVGADGRLRWPTEGARSITVGDLERTAEEGLFSGDAAAFVYEESTVGDSGVVVVWHEFLQWLDFVESHGGGAVLVWEGAKTLKGLLQRKYKQWRGEGARTPSSLFEVILGRDEWEAAKLMRMLGLTSDEAEDLLEALGFEEVRDGVYRASNDPQRAALREQLWQKVIEYDPESWKRPVITVEGADYDADYEEDDDD